MKLLRPSSVFIAVAFLVWATVQASSAADVTSEFESANRLYEQGKFDEAVAAYRRLLDNEVVSPALYFNLGNAYFKSGRIGFAIAAYRIAQQLSPRDPDIRANLQFARNQVKPPTLPPNRFAQLFGTAALNEWTTVAAAAFWVLFVLLAVEQVKPQLKPRLRPFVWLVSGVFLTLVVCVVFAWRAQRSVNQIVVIIAPEVTVRQGPLDDALTAFVVQDGAELKVLDKKDDWLQVSAGPRRVGWVKRAFVQVPIPHTTGKPARTPATDL